MLIINTLKIFVFMCIESAMSTRNIREAYASPSEWKKVNYNRNDNNNNNQNYGHKADFGYTSPPQENQRSDSSFTMSSSKSAWCYYCASPRNDIEPSVVQAMDQLFDMRTTNYPYDAVYPSCHNLSSMTTNPPRTQRCRYDTCHTITFTDSQGAHLTVRGCAEKMTAVHEFVNDYCRRVHQKLNIVECFCRDKHLCMGSNASPIIFNPFILIILCLLSIFYYDIYHETT